MLRTFVTIMFGLLCATTSAIAQTCSLPISLPNNLTNGTNADATQVMANFNVLLNCINNLPTPSVSSSGAGFLNKLRNGTFVSWPNGTSGTIATSPTGSAAIAANGWAVLPTGASITWAQVTSGRNGAPQSLKVTGNTSVTDVVVGQRIESTDAAALAAQTVTFQAAIYNNTGASITPTLTTRFAGSPDVWSSPTVDQGPLTLQACANATWCTEAYTFAVSASAANGYEVKIDFGNNFSTTSKYVQMSAADLRSTPGATTGLTSTPPTPELPDASTATSRALRYFETSYDNGVAPGSATHTGMVGAITNVGGPVQLLTSIPFSVPKRAAPTISYWDGAGSANKISYNYSNSWTDNITPAGGSIVAGTRVMQSNIYQSINTAPPMFHYSAYADFW